ncbi:hypothetical protein GCM10009795_045780 [Nocardioides hankookensis]|uniref:Nuclease-related domain-containing protein n=1 Tax=Nocardioides hankookensis TaxID=443157 RepID=A0ABW1LQU3_9ACTN
MAGESAREVARRQREKAARLEQAAARWERGAAGEEAVATALAALPRTEWTVVSDVQWPGRRFANIDHVVIGPGGVFVIDAKNWSGKVEVVDSVLRQNGRHREPAVAGGSDAALAVAQLASLDPSLVHPVLCFVRDDWLSGWARDVMVCSTFNLVTMLVSRPTALAGDALVSTRSRVVTSLRPVAGRSGSGASGVRRTTGKPTTKPTPKRGRSPEERKSGWRLVAAISAIAFLLFGLPTLAPKVGELLAGVATAGLVPKTADIGEAVIVPAGSTRPELRVTTIDVRSRAMRHASAVVVQLKIENAGSGPYESGPELRIAVRDDRGATYRPRAGWSAFGRHIAAGLSLTSGESTEGKLRFDLPADARPAEVRLVLGAAGDETVDWRVLD